MREDALEKIIMETVDVPSLPPIAAKVMQLISSDYSSITELERLIERDQAFSARLLRIANSPYYGRGRSIDTVSAAIILIGFNSMKSLVAAASMKDIHRRFGLFEQRHWEHSLGVSLAATLLANETQMISGEEAMIGGLIHDMGKIILNNSVPETYSLIIERVYEEGLSSIHAESEMLGFNHCNVGGLIARKWKLPRSLEAAIEYHHADTFPPFEDQNYEILCQIIRVADAMCLHLGIGLRAVVDPDTIGFSQIGLTGKQFTSLTERLKKDYIEQKSQLLE
ncbi:MAG: HDOD domain-containing protein [Nitrospirota bacterium]